jgi:hypothetical protein
MARESKRVRNERRFGRPQRLADVIFSAESKADWMLPDWAIDAPEGQRELFWDTVCKIRHGLLAAQIIMAQNACDLYWKHSRNIWEYESDFPNSSPPFPAFFVESVRPECIVMGDEVTSAAGCPEQWGFFFWVQDHIHGAVDFPVPTDAGGIDSLSLGARWTMQFSLILRTKKSEAPEFLPVLGFLAVAGDGKILRVPTFLVGGSGDQDMRQKVSNLAEALLKPILFSLSFLHCKNVEYVACEPDHQLNRERRKAGLKPFLRYHTIDIEPMKKVLRTEGNSETEGLKRAMHICRGHFATYSEEKPLFGRTAGTFWVPAHVRGSLKEGVVVSDYRVNAPAPVGKH